MVRIRRSVASHAVARHDNRRPQILGTLTTGPATTETLAAIYGPSVLSLLLDLEEQGTVKVQYLWSLPPTSARPAEVAG